MRTAICGVWHVHAPDYTKHALNHGEVLGFYEEDDGLAAACQAQFDLPRFPTLEALLARTDEIQKPSVRRAVEEHRQRLMTNHALILLDGHEPLPFPLERLSYTPTLYNTTQILQQIGLR